MPKLLAALRADASVREAIARTSHQALFCKAGMTLVMPILAVPSTPHTTLCMSLPSKVATRWSGAILE
jgi:hypothetical protein